MMIASPRHTTVSNSTSQAHPAAAQAANPALPQEPKAEQINMTTVLVALIGALATILAAFFASPVAEQLWYDEPPPLSDTHVIVHVADDSGRAIDGAKVSLFFESGQFNKWTYSNGSAKFIVPLPDGEDELDVSMTVEHDEYQIYNRQFEIPQEKLIEIRLNKKNKHSAKVIMRAVDDQSGLPLAGTNILLLVEGDTYNQVTDSNGIAEFVLPFPDGKIDAKISVTPQHHAAHYQHVTLLPNKVQDLRLLSKEKADLSDGNHSNEASNYSNESNNSTSQPSLVATPAPVYVVVLTPEIVSTPPVAAAIAPSPTPTKSVEKVTALGGLLVPPAEDTVIQSALLPRDSTDEEAGTALNETDSAGTEPTETELAASSTPTAIEKQASSTPTATKERSTETPTPTLTATEPVITKTPTPTATTTEMIVTKTPTPTSTATATEPAATKTAVPTATKVLPTVTPTISLTVMIISTPETSGDEQDDDQNDGQVYITGEENTSEPTEEVMITIEPTATATATEPSTTTVPSTSTPASTSTSTFVPTSVPTSTPTTIPAATATATRGAVAADERGEVDEEAAPNETAETEQDPIMKDESLLDENEPIVEDEPTPESILTLDAYPTPNGAYP